MMILNGVVWGRGDRRLGGPLCAKWDAETIALHGPNGCGKTTLLRTIVGVLTPLEGSISICGNDLVRDPVAARRQLGWMPDRAPVPGTTRVGDLWELVRWAKRLGATLPPLASELGIVALSGQCLAECSLGQQRRACLVAAVMGDPAVLVMDEPDRGLDLDGLAILSRHVRSRAAAGRSTIVVTHNPTFAESIGAKSINTMTWCEMPSSTCRDS